MTVGSQNRGRSLFILPGSRSWRKQATLILALAFCLPGCVTAGGGLNQRPAAELQGHQPLDEIAALAAENSSGSRQISVSPFGGGTATLGESYFSALGLPCRRVFFVDNYGKRHNLAVCDETGGVWKTVPDIFEYSNNRP